MNMTKLLLGVLAVLLYAGPGLAQECATQDDCARLVESLVNGQVMIDGDPATQALEVTGCDFVRRYTQNAMGCSGDSYVFEQTDTGTFAALNSAFVQPYRDNAVGLLFSDSAVLRYRYCEECRVRERTIRDVGMALSAVDPGNAQRLAAAVARLGRLCGASGVNQPDPVTTEETRTRRPAN